MARCLFKWYFPGMYEALVNYKELKILKKSKVIYSPFDSPLLKLIEFVYKYHTDNALFILRQRIHLNYSPTEFEKALIKVCAKRSTNKELAVRLATTTKPKMTFNPKKNILSPQEAVHLAIKESLKSKIDIVKFKSNRQIGAVLLDANYNLLSTGHNQSFRAKNLHAEFICLRSFWRKTKSTIPKGSKLFVTLKPCRMCSSLLHDLCESPDSLEVYYIHNDPGPLAQNTILEHVTKCMQVPL